MRYLIVNTDGTIFDSESGQLHSSLNLSILLTNQKEGGVLAGRNLYALISSLSGEVYNDSGWTLRVHAQHQRTKDDRVHGVIYYSSISYRSPKIGGRRNRKRPRAIKWLVLNMELFTESKDIFTAAKALVLLTEKRGIKLRYSPGTIGGALLRASPNWEAGRNPAPRFISEAARERLPGNLYSLRYDYDRESTALYLDQRSSHHSIAAYVPLPDPKYLRARGRFRATEGDRDKHPYWLEDVSLLGSHIGVILANVEIDFIPPSKLHLYPNWCKRHGIRQVWIWTPELRLFIDDPYVKIHTISGALTSHIRDRALMEYGLWCLSRLSESTHNAIKPALLAAYGMLAVKNRDGFMSHTVHGRGPAIRSQTVRFPLINGPVYRTTVEKKRTPVIQNVVARGVIEAESNTRSIELARLMETQNINVLQIYADGIIVNTDVVPALPDGWRVACTLNNLVRHNPGAILADNLVKLPGIPNGRRTSAILPSTTTERG